MDVVVGVKYDVVGMRAVGVSCFDDGVFLLLGEWYFGFREVC